MPVTFGSVGDIISVSLLVKDVLDALGKTRGSAIEYQGVVRELLILDRALLEIGQLSREHEATPELMALCQTAFKAVKDCRTTVSDFVEKIKRYASALNERSSANLLVKSARKVQWALEEKEQVARFRAAICAHSSSLNMLLITANMLVAVFAAKVAG
jgi:hypothetical protein